MGAWLSFIGSQGCFLYFCVHVCPVFLFYSDMKIGILAEHCSSYDNIVLYETLDNLRRNCCNLDTTLEAIKVAASVFVCMCPIIFLKLYNIKRRQSH